MTYKEYICQREQDIYWINGVQYTHEGLIKWISEPAFQEFEQKIKTCFKNWFSPSEYFHVLTSGSTGSPKKIRLEKGKMWASARKTLKYFDLKPNDSVLLLLPADKIGGIMLIIRAIIGNLKFSYLPLGLNPLENNIPGNIKFASLTPAQVIKIHESSVSRDRLRSIKNILIGGGPISGRLENILNKETNKYYHSYAMTETISHVAIRNINTSSASPYFNALENVSFSVNENNQLIIHAPDILNEDILTNDIVVLRDESSFLWKGRKDNVINSGGIKIYPELLEKKLDGVVPIPFFLKGIPDRVLGEKLVLVLEVEKYSDPEKSQLMEILSTHLNKYQMPREIQCLKPFLRTGNGKIIR